MTSPGKVTLTSTSNVLALEFLLSLISMTKVYLPSAWVMALLPPLLSLMGALRAFISQAGAPLWSVTV